MIGIGTGNSDYEVEVFRKHYQIPFPLFSDKNFIVYKALEGVRTPYFIGVKLDANGSSHIIYTKVGGFQEPHQFLEQIPLDNLIKALEELEK